MTLQVYLCIFIMIYIYTYIYIYICQSVLPWTLQTQWNLQCGFWCLFIFRQLLGVLGFDVIWLWWIFTPSAIKSLQWRYNERDGVSNHRHLDCLLIRLFRCKSKKMTWGWDGFVLHHAHKRFKWSCLWSCRDSSMAMLKCSKACI